MTLDLQDSIVIAIQIIALILPTLGVYPYRIRTKNRNLIMHGFLCVLALILNLITIFWVMIPTFSSTIAYMGEIPILQTAIILLHATFGAVSIILGSIIIASWIIHPLGELSCSKTWRLMIPIYIIWIVTLILGLIIVFY